MFYHSKLWGLGGIGLDWSRRVDKIKRLQKEKQDGKIRCIRSSSCSTTRNSGGGDWSGVEEWISLRLDLIRRLQEEKRTEAISEQKKRKYPQSSKHLLNHRTKTIRVAIREEHRSNKREKKRTEQNRSSKRS